MDGTVKTEIREKALGYPLKYRINNHLTNRAANPKLHKISIPRGSLQKLNEN
jgi:hypothetical protein